MFLLFALLQVNFNNYFIHISLKMIESSKQTLKINLTSLKQRVTNEKIQRISVSHIETNKVITV